MAISLDEAQRQRDAWYGAVMGLATSQSYTIGTRTLTRVDLPEATREFSKWDQIVTSLSSGGNGGMRVMRIIPRDL